MNIRLPMSFMVMSRKDYAGGEVTFELLVIDNKDLSGQFIFTFKDKGAAESIRNLLKLGSFCNVVLTPLETEKEISNG